MKLNGRLSRIYLPFTGADKTVYADGPQLSSAASSMNVCKKSTQPWREQNTSAAKCPSATRAKTFSFPRHGSPRGLQNLLRRQLAQRARRARHASIEDRRSITDHGPLRKPGCFHHGKLLTGLVGNPFEPDGLGEADGGGWAGGVRGEGVMICLSRRLRRDRLSDRCQDKPVPGSDTVK